MTGLEQPVANETLCESQRASIASFMQTLNISEYRAICRKSSPQFNFKCDRATKETEYVALRDLIYLVQGLWLKRAKIWELDWGHLCGLTEHLKLIPLNKAEAVLFMWQKRVFGFFQLVARHFIRQMSSPNIACVPQELSQQHLFFLGETLQSIKFSVFPLKKVI